MIVIRCALVIVAVQRNPDDLVVIVGRLVV